MRPEVTDRYYRFMSGLPVDRPPMIEFGYWPQTIRRWLKENMPLDLTPAQTCDGDSPILADLFGLENDTGVGLTLHAGMNPTFEEKILERKEKSVVIRMAGGIVAEKYLADSDESSIPHFISFPVVTPDDWRELKQRYRLDDPVRPGLAAGQMDRIRAAVAAGRAVMAGFGGFYYMLRNWMGVVNLSLAFYEYPAMVHDMVEHYAELAARQIEQLPADVPIDILHLDEDMAYNHGPLVGPAMFREFLQKGYRRVMSAARRHGCELAWIDSDGNATELVPNWLEEGINIWSPLEVAAGVDPYELRRRHGPALRLQGGVAKSCLVEGGGAIDRELDRLRPLYEQGRYIPHIDHRVPPNVPYAHYCQYIEKKRKMLGIQ